jgi:crotonobetainyl-CoA:carnitine CoA-transferase CaiB-like acyl-CoA transferase
MMGMQRIHIRPEARRDARPRYARGRELGSGHHMSGARPLSGTKVVSSEGLIALPFCTQILSDLGAEIISIENVSWRDDDDISERLRTGRRKRRIAIDLRSPEGQQLARRLISQADVFASNLRPGATDKYNLGYAQIHEEAPHVVYAVISGFGHSGILPSPYETVAAYGPIAEAMGGVAASLGKQERGAEFLALGDLVTAFYAAIGILAALKDRDASGLGQYVDVAMADSLLTLNERAMVMHSLGAGRESDEPPPMSGYFLMDDLEALDGRFMVMVGSTDYWVRVCNLFGHPEWIDDEGITNLRTRRESVVRRVIPAIEQQTRLVTKQEAASLFHSVGVAAAPVMLPADILLSSHFAARQMLLPTIGEQGKEVPIVGSPIKLSKVDSQDRPQETFRIASPGQHTTEILRELGCSEPEITKLLEDGVVRASAPT